MRVTRFDHCNLHGPNIDGVVKFFTEVLDFSLTEAAETPDGIAAAFLSCSNKAHDVAFILRARRETRRPFQQTGAGSPFTLNA